MILSGEEVKQLHAIQLRILTSFIRVCDELHLKYYLVHGSLLGAIRYNGFFPYDDDIDVAMPRADYQVLLHQGQALLEPGLFLQATETEDEYPMAFGKIRDENTTYIHPLMGQLQISQGVYMDIFPIDFYPTQPWKAQLLNWRDQLYSLRINRAFPIPDRTSRQKLISFASTVFCPSWKRAVDTRSALYANVKPSALCLLHGGKASEKGIPVEWFGDGVESSFEGLTVRIPSQYDGYLQTIYGDWHTFSPPAPYMVSTDSVRVDAKIVDFQHSYRTYQKGTNL